MVLTSFFFFSCRSGVVFIRAFKNCVWTATIADTEKNEAVCKFHWLSDYNSKSNERICIVYSIYTTHTMRPENHFTIALLPLGVHDLGVAECQIGYLYISASVLTSQAQVNWNTYAIYFFNMLVRKWSIGSWTAYHNTVFFSFLTMNSAWGEKNCKRANWSGNRLLVLNNNNYYYYYYRDFGRNHVHLNWAN